MSVEQREYPRLEQEFIAQIEVVPNSITEPVATPKKKGIVKNISGGGIYLITPRMWKGTIKKLLKHIYKLSIEFYLPDFQNKIRVFGEVRWVNGRIRWWDIFPKHWGLGVRFIYTRPEEKDIIIKYIINRQIEEHLSRQRDL